MNTIIKTVFIKFFILTFSLGFIGTAKAEVYYCSIIEEGILAGTIIWNPLNGYVGSSEERFSFKLNTDDSVLIRYKEEEHKLKIVFIDTPKYEIRASQINYIPEEEKRFEIPIIKSFFFYKGVVRFSISDPHYSEFKLISAKCELW